MKIRTFRGKDRDGVLRLVKNCLGDDAIVLETRRSATAGSSLWTAVAAVDSAPGLLPGPRPRRIAPESMETRALPFPDVDEELGRARETIRYLTRLVASDHYSSLTPAARGLYLDLLQAEVDADIAIEVVERVSKIAEADESRERELWNELMRYVRTGGTVDEHPRSRQIVMFAGGPGSGKTTTCAKLAAGLRDRGHSVALVAYGARGVHPLLESYGDVLGLPTFAPHTPAAVSELLSGPLSATAKVVVDTPAPFGSNGASSESLRAIVDGLPETLIHLVVPATERVADQLATFRRLENLGFDAISFTKLDQTGHHGSLLSLPQKAGLPIAYLCDGPRIPEDLRRARGCDLVEMIAAGLLNAEDHEDADAATGELHEAPRSL